MTAALVGDLGVLLAWSLACWCLGVAFAIYRALSWVERMRAWAAAVSADRFGQVERERGPRVRGGSREPGEPGSGTAAPRQVPLARRELDTMGVN